VLYNCKYSAQWPRAARYSVCLVCPGMATNCAVIFQCPRSARLIVRAAATSLHSRPVNWRAHDMEKVRSTCMVLAWPRTLASPRAPCGAANRSAPPQCNPRGYARYARPLASRPRLPGILQIGLAVCWPYPDKFARTVFSGFSQVAHRCLFTRLGRN
jgi:hypothetical protein